jgi:tRNA(adenine34) deaminase
MLNSPQLFVLYISFFLDFSKSKKFIRLKRERKISIFSLLFETNSEEMVQKNEEFYMRAALAEANKAFDKQEIPVGAVVVCDEMIIARAHNLTETLKDPTAHAEMQVITAATNWLGGKYLTGCTIYVTLEPCAMCAGAIGWSQASSLVFGAGDKKKGFRTISGSLLHPKTSVESGLLEDECKGLLTKFFKLRR